MRSKTIKPITYKKYTLSKYYKPKSHNIQNQFSKMLNISIKTLDVAQHLKESFYGIKIENKKSHVNVKDDKMMNRRQIIKQFETRNQNFFMPSLQVKYETKSRHHSLMSEENQPDPIIKTRQKIMTNPSSPIRQHFIQNSFKRRIIKHSLPSHQSFQVILKNKRSQVESPVSKKSIKRTNTFLFNINTKIVPKKTSFKQQKTYQWQDQLHQNLNMIQQTHFKGRHNIKIEKEKLSQYLKSIFMNQVITSYYKCQNMQNFKSIKLIVEDLMRLTDKQLNIITFFTYDVNCDGYICEEDLYFFLQRLPYASKILEDLYFIIEFLKKNKVRSNQINLPRKLMKKRQKSAVYTLWDDFSLQIKKQQSNKAKKLSKKLFPLFFKNEQETEVIKQKVSDKKFQINFDVFNLIFSEKRPVIIPEIIQIFTEKPRIYQEEKVKTYTEIKQTQNDNFSYTRSQFWKNNIARSMIFKERAKKQHEALNQRI